MKLDAWKDFIVGLFTERSARVAASALVMAIVLAGAVSWFMGGPPGSGQLRSSQQTIVVAVLIIAFAMAWFILYVLSRQELIDVFTKVRKQMSGRWLVTYSASVNYQGTEDRIVNCDVRENLIRKLEFEFEVIGNPIFQDQKGQVVKDIALREVDAKRYSLFYYFETNRRLVKELRDMLIFHGSDDIQIETLGILFFEAPSDQRQSVKRMDGKWYDLNGNMMRILELVRMKREADVKGEIFKPIPFDQIPVSDIHFDADMGGLTFQFQGKTSND